MDVFTIRDLRLRTGDLVRGAEGGHLSVVTKHGRPLFVAMPFDDAVLEHGTAVSLAAKLYAADLLTLARAAKLAQLTMEDFVVKLGLLGIPIADYPPEQLDAEIAVLD
jgi:prevent-host-death family protein